MAHALTTWRLGIGLQTGYNSQVFQPLAGSQGGGAFFILASPFFDLKAETGRLSETLQLTGLFTGNVLVQDAITPGQSCASSMSCAGSFLPSWQIAGISTTKIDLSARLKWTLLANGSVGEINTFSLATSPAAVEQTAINTAITSFAAAGASSTLQWDPTARLKVTQLINFHAFIPISTVTNGVSAASLQSYNIDAGVGLDREWARFTLGGELRVGWFDPSRELVAGVLTPDQPMTTAQIVTRSKVEFTPRLQASGQIGVYVASQAGHFLQGPQDQLDANGNPVIDPTSMKPLTITPTVAAPIGGAELRYMFPGIDLGLSLAYSYSVGAEVFIGQITESHSVTLRGTIPLSRGVVLSAGAGYRRSDVLNPDFSASEGVGYDYALADFAVAWHVRDGVNLLARYEFIHQRTNDTLPMTTGAPDPFPDFDRHIVLLGVSLFYPPH